MMSKYLQFCEIVKGHGQAAPFMQSQKDFFEVFFLLKGIFWTLIYTPKATTQQQCEINYKACAPVHNYCTQGISNPL